MSDIIIYIMAVFAVLGAIDKLLGNRFGLGKQFDEGICTCAPLALSMVGILVLAPVLAQVLEPVVVPARTRQCLQVRFWHMIWVVLLWRRPWPAAKRRPISAV